LAALEARRSNAPSAMAPATMWERCEFSSAITARATTRAPVCSPRRCFATCLRKRAPTSMRAARRPPPRRSCPEEIPDRTPC
jgi:hypothetical protein